MIKVEKVEKGVQIASFEGIDKITALNADTVKKELNSLFTEPIHLIIDLENINFVDSSGFGAFLSILKTSQSNGSQLRICNINTEIMKLFSLLHLDNVFDLYTDIKESIDSF